MNHEFESIMHREHESLYRDAALQRTLRKPVVMTRTVTVTLHALGQLSKVEAALKIITERKTAYDAVMGAYTKRMDRIKARNAARLKCNFDYLFERFRRRAEVEAEEAYLLAYESYATARASAVADYKSQKVSWFRFKTPISTYRRNYMVDELFKKSQQCMLAQYDEEALDKRALSTFVYLGLREFAQLIRRHPCADHSTARLLGYANRNNENWHDIVRDQHPSFAEWRNANKPKKNERRLCNQAPIKPSHIDSIDLVTDYLHALRVAGNNYVSVPTTTVETINAIFASTV